jgi:hypothetical protein
VQLVSPAVQAVWLPEDVMVSQERPEQQAAVPVPPAAQCWLTSMHVAALTQAPEVLQVSPSQQVTAPPQVWFRSAQAAGAAWQVPAVAPGWMLQERPKQQSADTVQAWFCCWQYRTQVLLSGSHEPEQQSVGLSAGSQATPGALQAGATHFPPVQVPEQQSALLVQAPSWAMQVPPQRRTPVASGTQGVPPQHWSRNWQTFPCAMQQFGSFAS